MNSKSVEFEFYVEEKHNIFGMFGFNLRMTFEHILWLDDAKHYRYRNIGIETRSDSKYLK